MTTESIIQPVPDNSYVMTLGEACALGGGNIQTGPFGSQLHAEDYVPIGIPSVMPQNIGDNRINIEGIAHISPRDAQRLSRYLLESGDIVYSRRGDVELRALVRDREHGWLCGTGCLRVRFGNGYVHPPYATYYLGHPDVRAWVVRHAVGATMPNLNTSILSALPFLVPPLEEQRAIANILGSLDDKIELNRRMNETLEAMARAIFKSWFVDFDPVCAKAEGRQPPGMDATTGALFPNSFEDSPLGKIPKGWRVASLGDLFGDDEACVLTGPFGSNLHAHDYREEGVPLILVKHVVGGQILEDDLPLVGGHKLRDLERYRLKIGDIVFTRVGAVGRSAYVQARHAGWLISGQMLRVRVPEWKVLHPRYLAQVFLEKTFTDMVEGYALGTTRPSLNTGLLRAFKFIAPPGPLVELFASKVSDFDAQVQVNHHEFRTLAALRDALLPKLISGEIRVNDTEKFVEACI